MSKISYKKLIRMDMKEYSIFIENGINSKLDNDYFYEINKVLRNGYSINPEKTINLLKMNLQKFNDLDKPYLYAMTLVSTTKIHIDNNNVSEIINLFSKTIHYVCEKNIYSQGKEIINYFNVALGTSLRMLTEDDYLQIIKLQIDFYRKFNKFENCINLMCEGAFLFTSNNAYQSAYRLLNDAQIMALTNERYDLQLEVLITQASICLQEHDFENAKVDFDKASNLSKRLGIEIPLTLRVNMSTLLMKSGKYEEALFVMDEILNNETDGRGYEYIIKVNKSICLREIGYIEESIDLIQEVLDNTEWLSGFEIVIEANLIAAKNYLALPNYVKSLHYINEAMQVIDLELQYKDRLHYRRGYKGNYIIRIIPMVLEIVSKSKQINYKDIMRFLAFTKSNMFSDWLSILDWYDKIMEDSSVNTEDKKLLENVMGNLVDFGAPILNGYREKYDDPFESIDDPTINPNGILNYDKPWKDFNNIVEMLKFKYSKFKNPYENSGLNKLQEILEKKINNNAFIISFFSFKNKPTILTISNVKCEVIELDKSIYTNFYRVLHNYQNKSCSFSEFTNTLKLTIEDLFRVFDTTTSSLISNGIKEIIILQDRLYHFIPLIPTLLLNPSLCKYIEDSEFVIKNVPIIYNGKVREKEINNFLGVLDPSEGLPLFKEELLLGQKYIKGTNEIVNLEDKKIKYDSLVIKEADILHIATHGYPISRFTDPTYASLAGPLSEKSIGLEEIQRNFWKLNYSLCINASCDSSDFTNRNYQKTFDTNELIGYSTLFLLNRKSNIISINWPIKDIVSYAFSHIFYSNLARKYSVERAFAISLVTLINLDKAKLKDIISSINDTDIRHQKLKLIENIKSQFPFRDPYCYGAFAMNCLI